MDNESLSVKDLARGAAIERFDDELQVVLDNVVDPNTGLGAREVTLKVKIKPNENRDRCDVQIICTSKLGASKPVGTVVYVGRGVDGAVASEYDPKQLQMELDAKKKPALANNVRNLPHANA